MDAWATGLAYRRIVKRRRAGRKGLAGGYWGHARQASRHSVTGRTDGYLQAPSTQQAATAAILRSAYLRHATALSRSGSTPRGCGAALACSRCFRPASLPVRHSAISPNERCTTAGRTFSSSASAIYFRSATRATTRRSRCGSAMDSRSSKAEHCRAGPSSRELTAAARAAGRAARGFRRALRHRDRGSDTSARHGQADAANAWLQVLSGETIPGLPSVLRTRRNGHGSRHASWCCSIAGRAATPRDHRARSPSRRSPQWRPRHFIGIVQHRCVEVTIAGTKGDPPVTHSIPSRCRSRPRARWISWSAARANSCCAHAII